MKHSCNNKENINDYKERNYMKIKIFIITFIIILMQYPSFATELINSKQIQDEKIFKQNLEATIINMESLPYKLLMLDELYTSATGNDNTKSYGMDILKLKNKYQNNKQSDNYIYSDKAYFLYLELCKEVYTEENIFKKSENLSNKKIIIPNSIYNKLDKNLVEIINCLNVMADNI